MCARQLLHSSCLVSRPCVGASPCKAERAAPPSPHRSSPLPTHTRAHVLTLISRVTRVSNARTRPNSTAGIGRALAISCLSRGAHVTIVGRRQPDENLSQATFVKADLSTMRSARALATEKLDLPSFDIVVFTNGIITTPERKETEEGLEVDMAVSMLSRLAIASEFKAKDLGANRGDKSLRPR